MNSAVRDGLTKCIATFCGIGYIPFVPATWASAAVVVLLWFVGPQAFYALPFFMLAGFWACAPSQTVFKSKDPKQFVMDEVCGMMITLWAVPRTLPLYISAFFVFRLFDVWKPGPIGQLDKLPRPSGIMWDDLLAGTVGCGTLHLALWMTHR